MNPVSKAKLLARTVMIRNGDIEKSFDLLNRVLTKEGFMAELMHKKYAEKPCNKRRRLAYERGKRIYDSEMQRKLRLLSRLNRQECWPR